MADKPFRLEFRNDVDYDEYDFYVEIDDRIRDLAEGHKDIVGAAATLEAAAEGRVTTPLYVASVVLYMRPKNISATEKHEDPIAAVKGALDAMERQVRQEREKNRNY